MKFLILVIGVLLGKSLWASPKLIYHLLSSEVWTFSSVFDRMMWTDVALTLSKLLQGQLVAEKWSLMYFSIFNPLTMYQQNFTWKINWNCELSVGNCWKEKHIIHDLLSSQRCSYCTLISWIQERTFKTW